jgi:hypothetical protein
VGTFLKHTHTHKEKFIILYFRRESKVKMSVEAEGWWLICVILATQEAEIRRIMVQSQPGQKI